MDTLYAVHNSISFCCTCHIGKISLIFSSIHSQDYDSSYFGTIIIANVSASVLLCALFNQNSSQSPLCMHNNNIVAKWLGFSLNQQ